MSLAYLLSWRLSGANASLVLALLRDWTILSLPFYYFHIPASLPQGDVIPGHLLLPHLKATANQAFLQISSRTLQEASPERQHAGHSPNAMLSNLTFKSFHTRDFTGQALIWLGNHFSYGTHSHPIERLTGSSPARSLREMYLLFPDLSELDWQRLIKSSALTSDFC